MFGDNKINAAGGVSGEVIAQAEENLGFPFSADYKEYLAKYGMVEHDDNELFGLGKEGYRNVVTATLAEREGTVGFSADYAVIFNLGIDHILILLGKDGAIYEYAYGDIKRIFDSFTQWITEEFLKY